LFTCQFEVDLSASLQAKQISSGMIDNLSHCQAEVIKGEDLSKEDTIVA